MDDDHKREPSGADGWIDPYANTEWGLPAVPPARSEMRPVPREDVTEAGKPMALLSHSSVFLGLPLFIIPMMQRDNAFALQHAKAAAVNYIAFMVAVAFTVVTCGLGFPLILGVYIPMIIGVVNAVNGELAGSWAWGGTGERLFRGLQPKDETRLLE